MATATSTAKRPATCHELALSGQPNASFGQEGCKRLPRHSGEHRAFLTVAAANRAAKPKRARKSPKAVRVTKADIEAAVAAVAEGKLAASELLSLIAASQRKTARKPKAAAPSEAAAVPSTIVRLCAVVNKSGKRGQVTKIVGDRATVRFPDGKNGTYLLASLTRVPPKGAVVAA